MSVEFVSINLRDISYICANLRPSDAVELFCQRSYSDGYTLAQEVVHYWGRCAAVVHHRGQPVAALGVTEMQPGVWAAWAFGTIKTGRVVPYMSRYMMRVLIPAAVAMGARRVEARSISSHHAAHRWIRSLGAHGPVELEQWGKGGETFLLFWWTLPPFMRGEYPYVRSSERPSVSSRSSTPTYPREEPGLGGDDPSIGRNSARASSLGWSAPERADRPERR